MMANVVRFYSDAAPPRHQEAIRRCIGVGSILAVEQCVYLAIESTMSEAQWQNLYLLFDYAKPKSSLTTNDTQPTEKKVVEIAHRKPLHDPWAIRVHHELQELSFPVLCVARSFRYRVSNAAAVRAIVSTFPATSGHLSGCIFHDSLPKLLCEPNPPLETAANGIPSPPPTESAGKVSEMLINLRGNQTESKCHNFKVNMNTISRQLLAAMPLPSSCFERLAATNWAEPLIAQTAFVGPFQLPLANFRVEVDGCEQDTGTVVAYGRATFNRNKDGSENSNDKHRVSYGSLARLALAEAVGKLAFAKISRPGLKGVTANVTFKWKQINSSRAKAFSKTRNAYAVACKQLGVILGKVDIGILSNGPPEVIVKLEARMPNVINKVTQDLKWRDGSHIFAIDLARCRKDGPMDVDMHDVKDAFDGIQTAFALIQSGHVSGHPGVLPCVSEMAITGGVGVAMDAHRTFEGRLSEELFRDGMQLVAEVLASDAGVFQELVPNARMIALTQEELAVCSDMRNAISLGRLRREYLRHFYDSEVRVVDWTLVSAMRAHLDRSEVPRYHLSFDPDSTVMDMAASLCNPHGVVAQKHEVIVLSADDASGCAVLDFCFRAAAFRTTCISISALVEDPTMLRRARGIAFAVDDYHAPGLAQAKILAVQIRSQLEVEFREFFHRPDTFSLGVGGGGGHVLTLLWDLIEGATTPSTNGLPVAKRRRLNSAGTESSPTKKRMPSPARPVPSANTQDDDGRVSDLLSLPTLDINLSNRFECRWVHVGFPRSSASTVWTRDMEGSHFGCYLATCHGLLSLGGASVSAPPMQFTRDGTKPCAAYPCSNGSEESACGVVSRDGRHMALSISPQLAVKRYQWPWWPQAWNHVQRSPWMKLFLNAHRWCSQEK